MRAAAGEMRTWLEHLNVNNEVVKALSKMVIEVKTEIRFRPTDDGKIVPEATNDVKVKPTPAKAACGLPSVSADGAVSPPCTLTCTRKQLMTSTMIRIAVASAALALAPTYAFSESPAKSAGNAMERKGNAEEKAANAEKARGKQLEKGARSKV